MYDPSLPHSIMLVEPAMLLMYRSCENNPSMTDTLVEYLHNYVKFYEESRAFEFMKSVQRVLHDCQQKKVIKDIKLLLNPYSFFYLGCYCCIKRIFFIIA